MKKLLILNFILLFAGYSFSQNIRGEVLDIKTSEPIEGVNVYVKTNEEGTFTDKRGKYVLKLKSRLNKNDLVYFSHVGFVLKSFTYNELKDKEFSVKLNLDNIKLDEINVVASYKFKPKINFQKLASMENGIHSFGSTLVNGKIYVQGGDASNEIDAFKKIINDYPELSFKELVEKTKSLYSRESYKGDLYIYEISLNKWRSEDVKFRKRAYHNIIYNDNKIYVLGGKRLSKSRNFEYLDDKIEIYSLNNKKVTIDNTNPHQAVNFESFIYNRNLIVLGGSVKKKKNGKKIYSADVHVNDLETGLWYKMANIPVPKETKGVLVDNKIYLFGGYNERPLTGIESYDLFTGKWNNVGDLFEGLKEPAITHHNEIVYLFEAGKILTYHLKTGELKQYAIGLFLDASRLHYANNKLYIIGGLISDDYSETPSTDIFSIDLKEFKISRVYRSKFLKGSI